MKKGKIFFLLAKFDEKKMACAVIMVMVILVKIENRLLKIVHYNIVSK